MAYIHEVVVQLHQGLLDAPLRFELKPQESKSCELPLFYRAVLGSGLEPLHTRVKTLRVNHLHQPNIRVHNQI